ncbi:hypothetical protein [Nocardioides sambongensis]|uniref:hypothetical protein n=1 Tax=Nocardioides sambongensis TaxID=2589074 RepID=UPI001E44261F|nr:hypothetical protein [Nocardioides sambongensis]
MTSDQRGDVRALTRAAGIQPTTTRISGSDHPVLSELAPGERQRPGALELTVAQPANSGGGGRGRQRGGSANGASGGGRSRRSGSAQRSQGGSAQSGRGQGGRGQSGRGQQGSGQGGSGQGASGQAGRRRSRRTGGGAPRG